MISRRAFTGAVFGTALSAKAEAAVWWPRFKAGGGDGGPTPSIATLTPGDNYNGTMGSGFSAYPGAVPTAESATLRGNGTFRQKAIAGFDREPYFIVEDGNGYAHVPVAIADRAWTSGVLYDFEGRQLLVTTLTKSPVTGMWGYGIKLSAGSICGKTLLVAYARGVNGVERRLLMWPTVNNNAAATGYVNRAGSAVHVDGDAGSDTTGNGSTGSPYKTLDTALRNVGDFGLVLVKAGSTVTEVYNAGVGDAIAGLLNTQPITVRCDTPGQTFNLKRYDRVWSRSRYTISTTGTSFTCSGAPGLTGAAVGTITGSYIRNPATGEIRKVITTSGNGGTLDSAFSSDLSGATWETNSTSLRHQFYPNKLHIHDAIIDLANFITLNASQVTNSWGGILWLQNCQGIDSNGPGGPFKFNGVYPTPGTPFDAGCGYYYNANDSLGEIWSESLSRQNVRAPSQAFGEGEGFFGAGESTFSCMITAGMVLQRNCTITVSWDVQYFQQSNTRIFRTSATQFLTPYFRQHREKSLTVSAAVYSSGSDTTLLTFSGSPTLINTPVDSTFNDLHFLDGPKAGGPNGDGILDQNDPLNTLINGVQKFTRQGDFHLVSIAAASFQCTVAGDASGTVGSHCILLSAQHSDTAQWLAQPTGEAAIENLMMIQYRAVGREVQSIFADQNQNASGWKLSNTAGIQITTNGTTTATFSAPHGLSVGASITVNISGTNYTRTVASVDSATQITMSGTIPTTINNNYTRDLTMTTDGSSASVTFSSAHGLNAGDIVVPGPTSSPQVSSTLASAAAVNDTTISMTHKPPIAASVTVAGNSSRIVTSITGTGPYTIGLSAPGLSVAAASGAAVTYTDHGYVSSVDSATTVTMDHAFPATSAYAWAREIGIKTAGTALTLSTSAGANVVAGDSVSIISGNQYRAYSRIASLSGTSGTLADPIRDGLTGVSTDQTTWRRWQQGKNAKDVAILACVFDRTDPSISSYTQLQSYQQHWIVAQSSFGANNSTLSGTGVLPNKFDFITGNAFGVEDFLMVDNIVSAFAGQYMTIPGDATQRQYMPYYGLTLDNNVTLTGPYDKLAPSQSLGTNTDLNVSAVFDGTYKPTSGITRKLTGDGSKPFYPEDVYGTPVNNNSLVGAVAA